MKKNSLISLLTLSLVTLGNSVEPSLNAEGPYCSTLIKTGKIIYPGLEIYNTKQKPLVNFSDINISENKDKLVYRGNPKDFPTKFAATPDDFLTPADFPKILKKNGKK